MLMSFEKKMYVDLQVVQVNPRVCSFLHKRYKIYIYILRTSFCMLIYKINACFYVADQV